MSRRAATRVWREMLERAHEELARGHGPPRKSAARALEEVLSRVERLDRSAPDDAAQLELYDGVIAAVDEASGIAQAGAAESLAHTLAELRSAMALSREAALDALARAPLPPRGTSLRRRPAATALAKTHGFQASHGMPQLHAVERGPLPSARSAEPVEVDLEEAWTKLEQSFDETDEPAERSLEPIPDRVPGAGAAAQLAEIARDCMDDVGGLGMLRRVESATQRWHGSLPGFEERLLACVDALAALGHADDGDRIDLLAELERYARDAATVDPMRAFANVFVLGCIEGADTVRTAVAAARHARPEERAAVIDALSLAPHPGISSAMARLAGEQDATLVMLALEVMRRRRDPEFGTVVVLLAHPAASVRAAAARCLAACSARDATVAALESALEEESDGAAQSALCESLVSLDARAGLDWARRELGARAGTPLDEGTAGLLALVAVSGAASDGAIIEAWAQPHPAWAEAVGWHGSAALGDRLLAILVSAPSWDLRAAAARSLDRIGGLSVIEAHDDEPAPPPAELARAWADRRPALADDKKLRFGAPLSIASCLDELERIGTRAIDRDRCAFELAMLTAGLAAIDPRDWIERQRQRIAPARALFAPDDTRAFHRPGEWPADRLGKRWPARTV